MSTKEDFQKKLETIQKIPDNRIKTPKNIPVGIYIQEAENLYQWCQQDKDALIAVGLSWELVTDLPIRCGALKEAESIWNTQRFTQTESIIKWKEQAPKAYDLRKELMECFRFAFRKDDELMEKLRDIARGEGHADLIQDLQQLGTLGKNNPGLLAKINVDKSLPDKAIDTAKQLMQSLSEAATDKYHFHYEKKVRDQAYTHLKEAVDKIYEHGHFAFRHNPDRRRGYRSNYMYMKREKNRKKAPVNQEKSPSAPVSPAKKAIPT